MFSAAGERRRAGVPQPRATRSTPAPRDWILLLLLLFLVGFVSTHYTEYGECETPLNLWLICSYLSVIIYRTLNFGTIYFSHGLPDAWSTRELPQKIVWVNHWIVFGFMLVWTFVGCVWYRQDHACLPASIGGWGFVVTILLLVIYVFQHLSMTLRVLSVYGAIRREINREHGCCNSLPSGLWKLHFLILEHYRRIDMLTHPVDADQPPEGRVFVLQAPILIAVQRQGEQNMFAPPQPNPGLTREQISELPSRDLTPDERVKELCSICLVEFPQLPPSIDGATSSPQSSEIEISQTGAHPSRIYSADPVPIRVLPCTHVFHRECLDSWLMEKRQCPNCRVGIGPAPEPPAEPPRQMGVQQEQHPSSQVISAWMQHHEEQIQRHLEFQYAMQHQQQQQHPPAVFHIRAPPPAEDPQNV